MTDMQQQFATWLAQWQPVESPPDTGNFVIERQSGTTCERRFVDKSLHIHSQFGKIAPLSAAQQLADRLNKEPA